MPLFQITYQWTLSGVDSAVVEGKTANEAKAKFQQKFGTQLEVDQLLPTADYSGVEAIETLPFQYNTPENLNDNYEVII